MLDETGAPSARGKRENSLHAALKAWLAQPGDLIEARLDGWVADILRGEQVIEVQTGNFSALRPKLESLLPHYAVHVIYPMAVERWVRRISSDGSTITRRKSPKHARIEDIFAEVVYIGRWLAHPRLTLDVLLIHEEVHWLNDGHGSWRRKGWSVADRTLLNVTGQMRFENIRDYAALLPDGLPQPFSNRDLAAAAGLRQRLARKMTYTLREIDILASAGKRGRTNLFTIQEDYLVR